MIYYIFYHKAGHSVRNTRIMMDLTELSSAFNSMDKSSSRIRATIAKAY